jgi:hypothetical protein
VITPNSSVKDNDPPAWIFDNAGVLSGYGKHRSLQACDNCNYRRTSSQKKKEFVHLVIVAEKKALHRVFWCLLWILSWLPSWLSSPPSFLLATTPLSSYPL